MKIKHVQVSKTQLLSIPEDERDLFILFGHWTNEATILHKLLIFSQTKADSDIELKVHTSQALLISRIYIGKLFEGWEMLRKTYFGTKLSKEYEDLLSDVGKSALKKIKDYFSNKNHMKDIRDKFSFHYATDGITNQIKALDNSYVFDIFLGNDIANSLHYLSEEIVSRAMFDKIDGANDLTAMSKYMDELVKVSKWFIEFTGHCMIVTLDKYFTPSDFKVEEVNIPKPPNIEDVSIPYFITR